MCGITGFVGIDDQTLLRAMCESLAHRGPDDAGFYLVPPVGLAMQRLAIIDLTTGHQPITNETKDVWVVFNGEIYNYQALRSQLIGNGHRFSTTSDTETLVHLYEDYGTDFIHHLRGMFAIALWDVQRQRLVLARDRIGEKPLYYYHDGEVFLFGSEIKAILQAGKRRDVDPQAVCDFLAAGYVGADRTFYDRVKKLPPGHMLVYERGQCSTQRYWRARQGGVSRLSFEGACEELKDRLRESVRLCLKSDVEVGAFLSGGLDSSLAVALMCQENVRVQTFSVGYEGEAVGFNELQYAKRVAQDLGTQHHELILGAHSSMELLPRILWHYDEPHGEPTSVLVYLLCQFAREAVKVVMGGTGGDEVFFGYPRHAAISFLEYYRWIPRALRKRVVERIVMRWPESTKGSRFAKRAKRFVAGSDLPAADAYLSWVSLLHKDIRHGLLSAQIRKDAANPDGEEFLRYYLGDADGDPLLDRAARLDVEGYLPEYQLTYMDRMSMAHGLEVRSPLCDFELVDFVLSLPSTYRLKGRRSKHILKTVAREWLPSEICERRKVGFDSPIGQWFKGELQPFLRAFLAPEHIQMSGLLDPNSVQSLMRTHIEGRHDYSLPLWSLVALEGWYRMYIEDRVTSIVGYHTHDMRGAGEYGKAA
ncbi:MAG: asparagine synthase (glutamine-hydrolyzing) [Candidatus Binatia bacterium]